MAKIIALNLKMNLDYEEAHAYVDTVINKISDKHDVIMIPLYLFRVI
jgi:triosephosphate isomerase